jgi:hypothetical protein
MGFIITTQLVNEYPSLIRCDRTTDNYLLEFPSRITSQTNLRRKTMANSKLLKEAIADAKAVKETALANAKLALEEAFTPRLQSILSQKLRAEAEAEEKDAEKVDEELTSTGIGSSTSNPKLDAHTEFEAGSTKTASGEPGAQVADFKKVADINEEEGMEMGDDEKAKQDEIAQLKARLAELEMGTDDEEEAPAMEADAMMGDEEEENPFASEEGDGEEYDVTGSEEEETEEDDMDLEAIIRELEAQLGDESEEQPEEGMYEAEEDEEEEAKNENLADGSEAGTDKGEDPKLVVTNEAEEEKKDDEEKNEVIDLEEILREMEADMKGDDEEKKDEAIKAELNEAYKTIKSLQKTINEVNLLNAKLLFANKLFRAHNMTNEQKVKVIETLDRTKSVREVKLVYSTLAENFKYTTSNKSTKKSISEGIASKAVKSTKPAAAKQVIAESADFSDRFKKLAGIIK